MWAINNSALTLQTVSFKLFEQGECVCGVRAVRARVWPGAKRLDWRGEQQSPVHWSQRQQVSTEVWPACFPSSSSHAACSGADFPEASSVLHFKGCWCFFVFVSVACFLSICQFMNPWSVCFSLLSRNFKEIWKCFILQFISCDSREHQGVFTF